MVEELGGGRMGKEALAAMETRERSHGMGGERKWVHNMFKMMRDKKVFISYNFIVIKSL